MPESPAEKVWVHPSKRRRAGGDGNGPGESVGRPGGSARGGGGYAELAVTSNFTFLEGASHPEEFVERAAALGHDAAAIADTNTLAGVARAHVAAKEAGVPLAVGSRLVLSDPPGLEVLAFASCRSSYARLARLLTVGKRRAEKGECLLSLHDVVEHASGEAGSGLRLVVQPPRVIDDPAVEVVEGLARALGRERLSLAAGRAFLGSDGERLRQVRALGEHARVELAAVGGVGYGGGSGGGGGERGGVVMHDPSRKRLWDVVRCINAGVTLAGAGRLTAPNAERALKPGERVERELAEALGSARAARRAAARARSIALDAASFSLDELRYEYPDESGPDGRSAAERLRELTLAGARERYPRGVPHRVAHQIEHELRLIGELSYEPYFLTVHELVRFARSRGILCQGRGAAANSAVCYCLGVTAVDPERVELLFERFVSKERDEPPDIDIDFEHERREEVIQHIYARYGRDRAALTAEVITYRGRSAVREAGKALGLSLDLVDRMSRSMDWWEKGGIPAERLAELGVRADDPTIGLLTAVTSELMGFPRHLSQHVGGFVITRGPLCELVPIENASMADRTVIEWDKDDIEALGMLKVDCLGLGMLSAVGRGFGLVGAGSRQKAEGRSGDGSERFGGCGHGDGHQVVSGSARVAARDADGEAGVHGDAGDAERGAVRADGADAPGGGVCAVEHRGGVRAAEHEGLPQAPADRAGIARGADDAGGARDRAVVAPAQRRAGGGDGGDGPGAARPDPEHRPGRVNTGAPARPPSAVCLLPSASSRSSAAPSLSLHTIPPDDPRVYRMIARGDTVGVFQVESRAQMQMLPRLRPRCWYDLVVQVAIVRPGPIQGDMVHPYLRRRDGVEPVSYPDATVRRILGRTLGVPLFQEQAMALAIHCAGFTASQADALRRAIAAWKTKQRVIQGFGEKIVGGMIERGYERGFAERCFEQIKGFSEYGFPESHAASFAHIVYVSAWLKRHHPAAFAAAVINSQPMGFYAPAQLVRDAREHGVEIRPIDVNRSGWECSLEEPSDAATDGRSDEASMSERGGQSPGGADEVEDEPEDTWGVGGPALRLGMRLVKGLREEHARAIERAVRAGGPARTVGELRRRAAVPAGALKTLARADAFGSMGLTRQRALWCVRGLVDEVLPLWESAAGDAGEAEKNREPVPDLPALLEGAEVARDYASVGLTLRSHPVSFRRVELTRRGVTPCGELRDEHAQRHGSWVGVAGVVLCRQRPGTARGLVFVTLEDESGVANLVVTPEVYGRDRRLARHAVALVAWGRVERSGRVVHVKVQRFEDLTAPSDESVEVRARDFH